MKFKADSAPWESSHCWHDSCKTCRVSKRANPAKVPGEEIGDEQRTRAPGFVRGIINLRGDVIPVLSLGERFGMETADDTA